MSHVGRNQTNDELNERNSNETESINHIDDEEMLPTSNSENLLDEGGEDEDEEDDNLDNGQNEENENEESEISNEDDDEEQQDEIQSNDNDPDEDLADSTEPKVVKGEINSKILFLNVQK